MAIFTNQSKNISTETNQAKGSATLTWDEATFTWNDASGTWDNPFAYTTQTKSSTTFSNATKD